jgi:hypothetical protein
MGLVVYTGAYIPIIPIAALRIIIFLTNEFFISPKTEENKKES